MNGKSLTILVSAIVAGILMSRLCSLPLWSAAVAVGIGVSVYLTALLLSKKNPFRRLYGLNGVVAFLLFMGIGIFSESKEAPSHFNLPEGQYSFSGKVEDYKLTGAGDKALVALSRLADSQGRKLDVRNVKALVTIADATSLSYGDILSGKAYFNPYDKPGNILKADYENYLKSKHIFLIGRINSSSYSIEKADGFSLAYFKELRDDMEKGIEKTGLQQGAKDFLISILLGDKAYTNPEERIIYSDAGVAHIFAVSGFHVSLIAVFLLFLTGLVFSGRWSRLKYAVVLPPIWFYILLVGCSPSAVRAGIMLSIGFMALFLQRRNNPVKALGWAVVLILAFNGDALFDIGFQLSVVCVGSLLLIAGNLNFIDRRLHPNWHKIVNILLVTLVATFSSWLVCAFYFHRFSLMFIPLNLVAVPLLPLFIIAALIYIMLFNVGLSPTFLADAVDGAFGLFRVACDYVTAHSASFTGIHPRAGSVLLWVGGILFLALIFQRGKGSSGKLLSAKARRLIPVPALMLIISALSVVIYPATGPTGFIVQKNSREAMLSVYGQGEESFVTLPEETNSVTMVNGKKILSLRSMALLPETLSHLHDADIVLVCKGCKELSEEILDCLGETALLVTHPSLHWRYERKMLAFAREEGIRLHSLRYDGPLHLFD